MQSRIITEKSEILNAVRASSGDGTQRQEYPARLNDSSSDRPSDSSSSTNKILISCFNITDLSVDKRDDISK